MIEIPKKASFILEQLMQAGYEAYIVGGCVRDAMLGRTPGDWDITTSAKPEEIKALFRRTVDTGIQHGTVTILLGKESFEVTTYRIDGMYEDSRHPESVQFTSNLLEDLKRRDFTINAMAYNPKVGIIDAFEGKKDLKERRIRCVGNPLERFGEDALRMLRAIRFCGQLGFLLEEKTQQGIIQKADTIGNISAERIRTELNKLLLSDHPECLMEAYRTKLTDMILPEWNEMMVTEQENLHHLYNVGEHSITAVIKMNELWKEIGSSQNEKVHSILCWTMLLHDVGKIKTKTMDEEGAAHFYNHPSVSETIAKAILKRLRFDNETIQSVCHLIYWHDWKGGKNKSSIRKAMNQIGAEWMEWLFFVQKADILAQSPYQRKEKLEAIEKTRKCVNEIIESKDCITLKELDITGGYLIEHGWKAGKEIGEVLRYLLLEVLTSPELNEKQTLFRLAEDWKKKR